MSRPCRFPIDATAIGLIVTGADLIQLLLVRQGLKQVFARSGQTMPSDPLLRVIVWQLIAVGLALSPLAHSWLAFIPMLIFYIVAVRALYSLGTLLDTCGYGIRAARVRLSPQALGLGYFGLALAIVIAGRLAANHPIYDFLRPDRRRSAGGPHPADPGWACRRALPRICRTRRFRRFRTPSASSPTPRRC